MVMNRKNFKKWLKQFESDMTAATFAEAGEFETARTFMKEDRRILLALTDNENDGKAFKYAINLCKRIGAALEILFPVKAGRKALDGFISELQEEGIEHTAVAVKNCMKKEILKYTSQRRDILFVVVESSDRLDINCQNDQKKISDSWQNLQCPLVIVSDLASA